MTPVMLASPSDPRLEAAVSSGRPLLLVAVHCHQTGGPAEQIGRAVARVATAHPEVTVVVPGRRHHGGVLGSYLAGIDNALVGPPVPYGAQLRLAAASHLVLTDSQRLARAAAALGRPVLVLSESGTPVGRPVGTDEWTIVAHTEQLFSDPAAHAELAGSWLPGAVSA